MLDMCDYSSGNASHTKRAVAAHSGQKRSLFRAVLSARNLNLNGLLSTGMPTGESSTEGDCKMSNDSYAILTKLLKSDLQKAPIELVQLIYISAKNAIRIRKNEQATQTQELLEYEALNQSRFKGLPMIHDKFNIAWLWYLSELLEQDWSSLFSGGCDRKYYVYFHKAGNRRINFNHETVPFVCDGFPFYVGKGTGNRAYDLNRNQGHGEILAQLKKQKKAESDIVLIVKDGLTEPEALELESKFIYFFGTRYEKGRRGILVNLDRPPVPDMTYEAKKAKIRVKLRKNDMQTRGFAGGA